MITTIQPKAKSKPKQQFITQQYECGLYVAIYTDGERIPDQFGSRMTEEKFHKELRASINTRKATFVEKESTVL